MHIRHGDSCFLARAGYCRPLADYLPAVRSLADRYHTRRVFVATDSPAVVQSLREMQPVRPLSRVKIWLKRQKVKLIICISCIS
jgi:hypothetical protein